MSFRVGSCYCLLETAKSFPNFVESSMLSGLIELTAGVRIAFAHFVSTPLGYTNNQEYEANIANSLFRAEEVATVYRLAGYNRSHASRPRLQ